MTTPLLSSPFSLFFAMASCPFLVGHDLKLRDKENYIFNNGSFGTEDQYVNQSVLGCQSTTNQYSQTDSHFFGKTRESGFYGLLNIEVSSKNS
ncbi:hypothetical protein TanjilG_12034 [Lupinus angustifolius]|uniref:Legume lectin domain-containing protein n=1 Tax=Lupinus angustifolius TaxID=3871 RepID=A0A1J7HY13_LUPAN|nr:hypothetical protein TanjilG_12034 [Lupinus angustifolius]